MLLTLNALHTTKKSGVIHGFKAMRPITGSNTKIENQDFFSNKSEFACATRMDLGFDLWDPGACFLALSQYSTCVCLPKPALPHELLQALTHACGVVMPGLPMLVQKFHVEGREEAGEGEANEVAELGEKEGESVGLEPMFAQVSSRVGWVQDKG